MLVQHKFSTEQEASTAIELAIGRILRMGARPTEPGDVAMYLTCKDVVLDAVEWLATNCPENPGYKQLYYKHIFK